MNPKLITPLLLGAVFVLLMFRRARRSFGRQPIHRARLAMRVGVLCALAVLVGSTLWRDMQLEEALAGGFIAGALLALLGLRHTRFEATPQGRFYTPHTYIGVIVIALFIARLIYRVATGHADLAVLQATPPGGAPPTALAGSRQSPITLALIGLPIGYYVLYNLGVLRASRALADSPPGTASL